MYRLILSLAICCVLASWARAQDSVEDHFARKVEPMLVEKCMGCHGLAPQIRGDLDLRTRATMLRGGSRGAALVPGSAAKSLLYQSVLRTGDVVMPPKENAKLTVAEIAGLKKWIDAGAPWPVKAAQEWKADLRDAWAFAPLWRFTDPKTIDEFILAGLKAKKLAPAPAADRGTWLRRATYDLTGLPPTPDEIDGFTRDGSPHAFATVIDRLLARPEYGERMAQHWLDVVRYADTAGFSNDFERPHAWRYRDYVIRAFNEDRPFDRFVLEQIAGDEVEPKSEEGTIATGYLRMGPWEHTGMSVAAVTRQMWLDDVTNSVGVTFLGQGLSCARCHDHKFDPVPTRDYYRIQAVFAATQFAERPAPFLASENTAGFAEAKERARRLVKEHQDSKHLQPLSETKGNKTFTMISKKHDEAFQRAAQRYEPAAFGVTNGKPQEVAILRGGALEAPGDVVTPGVLSAITELERRAGSVSDRSTIPNTEAGRRLALAKWIASPKNPLTARVLVNRAWQMHFGAGLVETPNNFGKMGGRPSHPELLDWLARWFMDNGWSLKKLHRLIMTSAAYQRSGDHPELDKVKQADPRNRLLAYFPPRRLSAEEIRDSMLAASGELSAARGGPGAFPEINWEVALQPRHTMGGIAPAYQPSRTPEQRNRRTIYVFRYRTLPDPLLEVLNRPGAELSCERRDETTVTPQVFTLLNGQNTHARALAFARRLEKTRTTPAERIDLAFRLLYGRPATKDQRQACLDHLAKMTDHHRTHRPTASARPTKVVRQMLAEQTGELFRWEENLDNADYRPDLQPWDVGAETRALAEICLVLLNSNEFLYVY